MPAAPAEFAARLLTESQQTHPWLHHRLFRMIGAGELSREQVRHVIREQGCFFLDTLRHAAWKIISVGGFTPTFEDLPRGLDAAPRPRRHRSLPGHAPQSGGEGDTVMSVQTPTSAAALEQWIGHLSQAGLDAPWTKPGPLIRPKASAMQARVWRWRDIEPLVRRSPEFMAPGRGAERRIIRLDNPGVPERTAGHTISVAVQYLLPGEVAPAHRHTPSAIRFMLHGEGAFTTIEGDKFVMRRGDLVVTPSMTWHDHGNEGSEPVMWTDALDSPVVRYLENLAMDPYEGEQQPVRTGPPARHLHFPFETAYAALLALAAGPADPFDDVIMEYRDPGTGRSVVPALGCYLQMLRPGVRTRAHRETSSAVYHVVAGTGFTEIDGIRHPWGEGDFFAVPPRALHGHGNEGAAPALLYSVQDVPLLRALGFYRTEA